VRRAHFPFLKTIDEFDFTFQSSVRLALLGSVLGPELVTQGHCLIASGPSGTGKTHLAVAIAYRAIQNGFDARFTTATALIDDLSVATRKGKLRHALPAYTHPHVLVIDEVGYLTYGPDAANVLFHVVNERYLHHRPMIFTTNKPLGPWGWVLHDPDLAQAILDRVLERGRGRLTLRLRELGGLVRTAGDIAVTEGASLAGASHVERALAMALSAEEQLNGAASSLIPTERPPVVRLTRPGEGAAEAS
jgi:DNA replication protein DnaC